MKTLFCLVVLSISTLTLRSQFSEAHIIDDDSTTMGVRNMTATDISNNGFNDLIIAQGSIEDKLVIYWNSGNANFTKEVIDDDIDDPVYINFGDFNSNGSIDLIVLTESNGEIFFYENDGGTFQNRVLLGNVQSFGKSIAVEDFDGDGDLDFVVIGQHSIDFYRNDGNANFTLEHILTTATSPNILECFTMVLTDVNGNNIPDVVTGETIGAVAYINDGNANFTPHTITEIPHTVVTAISTIDANNNNKPDLVFHAQSGVVIYLNQSSGETIDYSFHEELFSVTANSIKEIRTGDFTQNGLEDIYQAHSGAAYYMENLSNMVFSSPIELYSENDLFIWEPLAADITGDSSKELIWAAAGGTIAYHRQLTSSIKESRTHFSIFPNPSNRVVYIQSDNSGIESIYLYNIQGKRIPIEVVITDNGAILQTQNLSNGTYQLIITSDRAVRREKVVVVH